MSKPAAIRRQPTHSKSFREGINILTDEITLACKWQRPSILLAVHKSKPEQTKAQATLEREIIKKNKRVKRIKISGTAPDVINTLCKTSNHDEIVFFISGIGSEARQKSGDVYRALNMHRELLVEQQIRVVFWLTDSEAAALPQHAPDFWAFRHRVVEFATRKTGGPTRD